MAWLPASGSQQNLYSELEIFREITTNKVLVSQASQYILQLVRLLEWYWSWWWFCLVLRHLNSLLTSHGLISISVTSAQPAIFREISVRSSTDAQCQWRMDSLPSLPPSQVLKLNLETNPIFHTFKTCAVLVVQQKADWTTADPVEESNIMQSELIHDVCQSQSDLIKLRQTHLGSKSEL